MMVVDNDTSFSLLCPVSFTIELKLRNFVSFNLRAKLNAAMA